MNQASINKILQQTKEIYNDIAADFSQTRHRVWPGLERFGDLAQDGDRILDLGCGNGRVAELFKDKKVDYLGIDNSSGLIAAAQEKFSGQGNFKFLVGDAINQSLPANSFDLVLLIAVLHHIPTERLRLQILQNAASVLKPGGQILMTNWNLWQPRYRGHLFNFYRKFFIYGIFSLKDALIPWRASGRARWRYVHNFSQREIAGLLQAAHFNIVEIYYDDGGKKASWLSGENLVVLAKK